MRAGLHYCDNHAVMKFFSKYLFLWWHELANSLRLLRLHSSFLQIIKNFSLRQRIHFLLILLYGLHFLSILHLMLKGLFAFLSIQMYLDNSVSFFFLWFRKDDVWFLYRSLKLVASPTYVSVIVLLSFCVFFIILFICRIATELKCLHPPILKCIGHSLNCLMSVAIFCHTK